MASTHLGLTGSTYYAKLVGSGVSPWSTGIVAFIESSQLGVFTSPTDDTLSYVVYLQAGGIPASSDEIDALVPGASPPPSFYQSAPVVQRSTDDTDEIRFAWPVTGATITGEVSKGGAAFGAVAGAISFLRTEAGTHIYQIAHNAADKQEGSVRYLFTDGTYTRAVNLEVFGAVAGGGGLTVVPLTAVVQSRVDGTTISVFTSETVTVGIAVVDAQGQPVTVTSLTLSIVIERSNGLDVSTIADGSITKTGSTISFAVPSQVSANEGVYRWTLRSTVGNGVLLQGPLIVTYVATVDA